MKVENIILNIEDKSIKLIDFGLACKTDRCDQNRVIGTLLYMAPEVLRKEKFSPKSDIWSVGIVLYVLLTGKIPYSEKDQKKLY